MLELIRSFLKTKGLGRGAWNLVSVKVGAVFCLVSKQWEKKKENLKTTTTAKPKSAPPSDDYCIGAASLSHHS